jgi:hypothetical protein
LAWQEKQTKGFGNNNMEEKGGTQTIWGRVSRMGSGEEDCSQPQSLARCYVKPNCGRKQPYHQPSKSQKHGVLWASAGRHGLSEKQAVLWRPWPLPGGSLDGCVGTGPTGHGTF